MQVLMSDVDSHDTDKNRVFPHCQLDAEYPSSGDDEKLPKLAYKINMIGAKEPNTYFVIKLDPNHKNALEGA